MRLLFINVFIFFQCYAFSQSIEFKKGSNSLMSVKADTVYKVLFDVKGTPIGKVANVKLSFANGQKGKNIDFQLLDSDSLQTDSLLIRVKNYSGSFLVFVRSGAANIIEVILEITINDAKPIKGSLVIKPYTEPEKPKEPEIKDSLIVELIKDLDVTVRDSSFSKKTSVFKKKKEYPHEINIDNIDIRKGEDGLYYVTVAAVNGERYSNSDGFKIENGKFVDGRLYIDGDKNRKPSLKIEDFIVIVSAKKENGKQTLTPQNRKIKIEAPKKP